MRTDDDILDDVHSTLHHVVIELPQSDDPDVPHTSADENIVQLYHRVETYMSSRDTRTYVTE